MVKFRLSAFADEISPDVDAQIAGLAANGIDMIELRGVDGESVADITPAKVREVADKLKAAGIEVSAGGSPIGKIGLDEDFEEHFDTFNRLLDAAKVLGTRRMRIFSFFPPEGEDPAKYRPQVMSRLRRLVDRASSRGVTLCHENEKSIYGDSPDRCLDIYNEFGGEVRCVFDHANFISCGYLPFPYAFDKLGRTLSHMHIKDATVDAVMVPTGEGIGRIPETLDAVRELYDGEFILTLEPHLMTFDGLQGLEKEGHVSRLANLYANSSEAFKAAATALRRFI